MEKKDKYLFNFCSFSYEDTPSDLWLSQGHCMLELLHGNHERTVFVLTQDQLKFLGKYYPLTTIC